MSSDNNKILVTGASSFIGRHVTNHLAREGLNVVATYRSRNAFLESLALRHEGLTLAQIDLTNWRDFSLLPSQIGAVVHIAGVSTGPEVAIDDMLAVNVMGTRHVQRYALSTGVRKIVHTSSLSVYGSILDKEVNELTAINNPDPYGSTKYLAERLLASTADQIPTVALRLPGILGKGAHRAWLPSLVDDLRQGKEVTIYNPNSYFNNAVHVDDLSKLITQLLKTSSWDGYYAFPLGASGKMTIERVVRLLHTALESQSKLSVIGANKTSFTIDSACARKRFGFVPSSIDHVLSNYINDLLYPQNSGQSPV